MLTMGVHPVDLMRWYAGDVVAVQAMGNQGMAMQGTGNPLDDAVTAVYRFASGVTGSITVCWASNYVFDSYYGLELHGSEASVVWDKIHGKEAFKAVPLPQPPETGRPGYAAEVDSVVDSLMDETPLFCDVHEGARSAIACLMAIRSRRRPVRRWKCRIRSVKSTASIAMSSTAARLGTIDVGDENRTCLPSE